MSDDIDQPLSPEPYGCCRLCQRRLEGTARLDSAGGGTARAYDCPYCGKYLIPPDLVGATYALDEPARRALSLRLRFREGVSVLTAGELDAVRASL